jgi:hypothetical protein
MIYVMCVHALSLQYCKFLDLECLGKFSSEKTKLRQGQ